MFGAAQVPRGLTVQATPIMFLLNMVLIFLGFLVISSILVVPLPIVI